MHCNLVPLIVLFFLGLDLLQIYIAVNILAPNGLTLH